MWNPLLLEEFRSCIADLIEHPDIQKMNQIKQHVNESAVWIIAFLFHI